MKLILITIPLIILNSWLLVFTVKFLLNNFYTTGYRRKGDQKVYSNVRYDGIMIGENAVLLQYYSTNNFDWEIPIEGFTLQSFDGGKGYIRTWQILLTSWQCLSHQSYKTVWGRISFIQIIWKVYISNSRF